MELAAQPSSLAHAPRYNWKLVLLLWLMSTVASVLAVPYILALVAPTLSQLPRTAPLPVEWIVGLSTVIQYGVLGFISAALGYFFSRRIGLGAPLLERVLRGESASAEFRAILPLSAAVGIAGALLIAGLDLFLFAPLLRAEMGDSELKSLTPTTLVNPLFGLLVSFQGGIFEELLLRYFLFALLAWLGAFISHTPDRRPTLAVLWIANILAALLFGLGHLPATAQAGLPLDALTITRALVLNGILGLAYAYLYWTRGLESAMLAHFSSDVVLHFGFALLT